MPVLEVCVDSVASAVAAQRGGADRVELCCALNDGGLTPSVGLLRAVRASVTIDVHVLIRPRAGDFVYTSEELAIMKDDIAVARAEGARGVAVGVLTAGGEVDIERTRELVETARPMEVTFHRATDFAASPLEALDAIVRSGADRVLTSGGAATAVEGRARIRELVRAAEGRIRVMAAGSVRAENIADLLRETGAKEWHTAARRGARSAQTGRASSLREQMGAAEAAQPIREDDVRRLREILDRGAAAAQSR